MIAHLFPDGQVERGTANRPGDRPGYRWVQAYSQVLPGGYSMAMTRREWLALGRRDNFKCKFHASLTEAWDAIKGKTT